MARAKAKSEEPASEVTESRWANRIVRSGLANPNDLKANAKNWRVHPRLQYDAMDAVLDKVGWVQEVIVNETTGRLVDGHLRVDLAINRGETSIPVKYVRLTEEEEDFVLATLDPIAALAEADSGRLDALLDGMRGMDGPLGELITGMEEMYIPQVIPQEIVNATYRDNPFANKDQDGEGEPAITGATNTEYPGAGADGNGLMPPAQPIPPGPKVRLMQLYLAAHTYDELEPTFKPLAQHFGVATITDMLIACIKYAYSSVIEQDAESEKGDENAT